MKLQRSVYGASAAAAALLLMLSACDQGDDRLSEKAKIEAAGQAEAENEALAARSREMESDLAIRHRFFQGVRGTYEGTFLVADEEWKIRITLIPTIYPYATERARRLEEVASDLIGLSLNAQIVQWTPGTIPTGAVGCHVEGIKPDLIRGEINIVSSDCSNVYLLKLASMDINLPTNRDDLLRMSGSVSRSMLDGKLDEAPAVLGEIRISQNNSEIYSFIAGRKP